MVLCYCDSDKDKKSFRLEENLFRKRVIRNM